MICADISRHDLIKLFTNLGYSSARFHIPNNRVAELSTAASTHDQQRTILAEFQRTRITFSVRENSGQLLGVGIVKQNLLLPRNGQK